MLTSGVISIISWSAVRLVAEFQSVSNDILAWLGSEVLSGELIEIDSLRVMAQESMLI